MKKQVLCLLMGLMGFSLSVFAAGRSDDDMRRLTEYNKAMATITSEIGPIKDKSKLAVQMEKPLKHKQEIEAYLKKNVKKYKAGSSTLLGDPVLLRVRDEVGYGLCAELSGKQVFAGYDGAIYYLFLFNGDLIVDVKNHSMLLGMNEVDDARVKLMNAEIDHACISILTMSLMPQEETSNKAEVKNEQKVASKKK